MANQKVTVKIIAETNEYIPTIRKIHTQAFPADDEADLVDQLRNSGDAEISLIALKDTQPVGHVMFSKLTAPLKALALAPVAVNEEYRKHGVAKKLIESGLEKARNSGWGCIVVLGDPNYYRRFGFSVELAKHFDCPYSGPHLMALSLGDMILPVKAKIIYPAAFDSL